MHFVETYAILQQSLTESRRVMYDDYDFDYTSGNDFELDESVFQHDSDDEDYSRDSHDYQDLAYRHYA